MGECSRFQCISNCAFGYNILLMQPADKSLGADVQKPCAAPGGQSSRRPFRGTGLEFRWDWKRLPAKPDATGLSGGDTLLLPLADKFPFRLRHIGKQLQHNVRDQGPGQIPVLPGIQQGHVQYHDGRLLFFGDKAPLFQHLVIVPSQSVDYKAFAMSAIFFITSLS